MKKPILFSHHAKAQLVYRGAIEKEVLEAIQKGKWEPAELGRLEVRVDFPFNQTWNGKLYKTKQVRPIFTEEENRVVIITIYVYYF